MIPTTAQQASTPNTGNQSTNLFRDICGAVARGSWDRAANQPRGLGRYMVRVIHRGAVVQQFEAMAESSVACSIQHLDLVPEGGKLDVMSIAAWQDFCRAERITHQNVVSGYHRLEGMW